MKEIFQIPNDLPDSKRDSKEPEPEEIFIDLPDVKDIPGQEFVHPLPVDALGDTTISSDGEEGVTIFGRDDSEDLRTENDDDLNENMET